MAADRSTGHELQRHQQLGWAMGSLGTAVMLGALTSYALFYMTTYLGIGVLVAGQLLGLAKFYDLVTDPLVGQLSDRTNRPGGRRRPYLLAGACTCPLALALLFIVPGFVAEAASQALTAIYIGAVLLLYATAFTLFNVPYLAMPPEMTTRPEERTLIMAQRIFFSTLGVLMISALGPKLIGAFGGGAGGYIGMSRVMAVVVFAAMLAAYLLTRHTRTVPGSDPRQYGLIRQWRYVASNRPFRFYILAKIGMFLSQSAVQGSLLFFAYYVLDSDESILAAFGVGYTIGSLAALPAWNHLISNYLGKRNAFSISALGLGLVFLTWLAAGPGEPAIALYARFIVLGVFSAGSIVSASAMLPDIMEDDRRRSGINQEGLYAAAFSVVEKVANTLGPVVIGLLLGLTGFVSARDGVIREQPEQAILAIRYCVSILPCGLACLAAWLMQFYELSEKRPGSAGEERRG